jgi:hypothetical protein
MLGSKSGVAVRLLQHYPSLFVWHCMNHRLELAVEDAVRDVSNVNQALPELLGFRVLHL